MNEVIIQPDCGNAPRKLFLKDFYSAMAHGDADFFSDIISETITWEIVGRSKVNGKENYLKALRGHKLWKVKKLTIDTIITHGPDASVSGQVITSDNSKFAFCDVYRFNSAGVSVIKTITTFLIIQ